MGTAQNKNITFNFWCEFYKKKIIKKHRILMKNVEHQNYKIIEVELFKHRFSYTNNTYLCFYNPTNIFFPTSSFLLDTRKAFFLIPSKLVLDQVRHNFWFLVPSNIFSV